MKKFKCKRFNVQVLFIVSIYYFTGISCGSTSSSTPIDIGTHSLNFQIKKGKGIPIIFESGGGNDGLVWEALATSLHQELGTTIITYDRAGYGKSGLNPKLSDADKGYILNTIKDLEAALKILNFGEELILVAHSYGGFTAALFSERNPELVKGIVLLDANLKCFFKDEIQEKFQIFGTDSLLNTLKPLGMGLYHEAVAFNKTLELIQNTSFPTTIPIIDIVAENPFNPFDDFKDIEKWNLCHHEFGISFKNRESHMAKNCGHYIFLDDPKMVEQKIITLYNQVVLKKY